MTKYIYFKNDGVIDIRAVTTLGVSAKKEGSIGYFGTGLKFAIARILRAGGSVWIWAGGEGYTFGVEDQEIRGADFQVVTMNGNPLGFTTSLGRDWEMWMAVREIACNCSDEGGYSGYVDDLNPLPAPGENETLIVVDCEEFAKAYESRFEYLLDFSKISDCFDKFEIAEGRTKGLFYRGVRVYTHEKNFIFHYNITDFIKLGEDRAIANSYWYLDYELPKILASCEDEDFIAAILKCGSESAEWHLSFNNASFSSAWIRAVLELGEDERELAPPSLIAACLGSKEGILSTGLMRELSQSQLEILEGLEEEIERLDLDFGVFEYHYFDSYLSVKGSGLVEYDEEAEGLVFTKDFFKAEKNDQLSSFLLAVVLARDEGNSASALSRFVECALMKELGKA